MTAPAIARAIDVGYGNTKFTTANRKQDYGCEFFPSIAPTSTNEVTIAGGMMSNSEFVNVEVDGKYYAVGKEAHYQASTGTTRILDQGFALTNDYLALVRGALHYMALPKIDMLVLGLPMNTYKDQNLRDALRARMIGGHTVPNPNLRKNKFAPALFSVEVSAVRILPQPVGAFFNYCIPRGVYQEMNAQTNLVIDVGHGTFDWFVAKGNKPINARCDAYFGGVSQIVRAVADALSPNAKTNLFIMENIDTAIRTGNPLSFKGEKINVREKFKAVIDDTVRKAVSAMMASTGSLDDVDNIFVTGGGASIYRDLIQQALPDRKLIIDEDPIYSNVRGFQAVGEQWASELSKVAA
jgi:plasmid segregation protein ParM